MQTPSPSAYHGPNLVETGLNLVKRILTFAERNSAFADSNASLVGAAPSITEAGQHLVEPSQHLLDARLIVAETGLTLVEHNPNLAKSIQIVAEPIPTSVEPNPNLVEAPKFSLKRPREGRTLQSNGRAPNPSTPSRNQPHGFCRIWASAAQLGPHSANKFATMLPQHVTLCQLRWGPRNQCGRLDQSRRGPLDRRSPWDRRNPSFYTLSPGSLRGRSRAQLGSIQGRSCVSA